ncbi:hypothetical protein M8J77_025281 [Diaphorina citri]|nr:hypothetical protein M8J77_025281 [Diaphorina citri]
MDLSLDPRGLEVSCFLELDNSVREEIGKKQKEQINDQTTYISRPKEQYDKEIHSSKPNVQYEEQPYSRRTNDSHDQQTYSSNTREPLEGQIYSRLTVEPYNNFLNGRPYDQQVFTVFQPNLTLPQRKSVKSYEYGKSHLQDRKYNADSCGLMTNTFTKNKRLNEDCKKTNLNQEDLREYEKDIENKYLECYKKIARLKGALCHSEMKDNQVVQKSTLQVPQDLTSSDLKARKSRRIRSERKLHMDKINNWKAELEKRKRAKELEDDMQESSKSPVKELPRKRKSKRFVYNRTLAKSKCSKARSHSRRVEPRHGSVYDAKPVKTYQSIQNCQSIKDCRISNEPREDQACDDIQNKRNEEFSKKLSVEHIVDPTVLQVCTENSPEPSMLGCWPHHFKRLHEKIKSSLNPPLHGDGTCPSEINCRPPLSNAIKSMTNSLVSGIKQISTYIPEVKLVRHCSGCSECAYRQSNYTSKRCRSSRSGTHFSRCFSEDETILSGSDGSNVKRKCQRLPRKKSDVPTPWRYDQPYNNYFIICEPKCLPKVLTVLDDKNVKCCYTQSKPDNATFPKSHSLAIVNNAAMDNHEMKSRLKDLNLIRADKSPGKCSLSRREHTNLGGTAEPLRSTNRDKRDAPSPNKNKSTVKVDETKRISTSRPLPLGDQRTCRKILNSQATVRPSRKLKVSLINVNRSRAEKRSPPRQVGVKSNTSPRRQKYAAERQRRLQMIDSLHQEADKHAKRLQKKPLPSVQKFLSRFDEKMETICQMQMPNYSSERCVINF